LPTEEFTGYNALASDLETLWWTSNWAGAALPLDAGIYGISNAALDTPWPKVVNGKRRFGDALASGAKVEDLFAVLADDTLAPDELLPDTGIGIELERLASPAFISSPDYGTTASTVLRIRRDRSYDVEERRFLHGAETGRVTFSGQF
ncbi:MAG TPA: NRDE family protein, partial [Aeromicrobium sp.]|nr:NRDE family protein [Aeromicrobium sp.]